MRNYMSLIVLVLLHSSILSIWQYLGCNKVFINGLSLQEIKKTVLCARLSTERASTHSRNLHCWRHFPPSFRESSRTSTTVRGNSAASKISPRTYLASSRPTPSPGTTLPKRWKVFKTGKVSNVLACSGLFDFFPTPGSQELNLS